MRSDDHLNFPRRDLLENGLPLSLLDAAPHDGNSIVQGLQNSFRIQKMLLGKNLRWRHEGRLKSIRNSNDNRFERDNGFTASDITLQQANHRIRSFQITNNFFENSLLGAGWMKRENHLHVLANLLGRLQAYALKLPALYTPERKDQLKQEKLFED